MFKKILIANRDEIACRVIRTAKKMGIATATLAMLSIAAPAQACAVPIFPDATFYGKILAPPPGCKGCGRRFEILDPQTGARVRTIQLSPIVLACYSPAGEIGEIGTLHVQGKPADPELMQHSFESGRRPSPAEQWLSKQQP